MNRGAVLLIDDDELVLASLAFSLKDAGFAVTTAVRGREAIALCQQQSFEVVVCDIRMPELNGIETLRAVKEHQPTVRTIVITGYADDPATPVAAIRLGVDDYLLKPFDDQLLVHSITQHVERFRLEAENARLCHELSAANARLRQENTRLRRQVASQPPFADIIGTSTCMRLIYTLLDSVIDSDITVLLTGETGTGKELVARAIHYGGPRREASFVPVHCGAIQESLLESELFGVIPHYPGLHSPTGKKGLLEEADKGTLFLDEIGEMSAAMQVKLLRALQDGEIQRIGDTRPRTVDVRLVVATHRDLEQEVAAGRFREDLYYRLTGIEIHLPPLRQRAEDIPLLAHHFLDAFASRRASDTPELSGEALRLLADYAWPGNVRELAKEIERAATLSNGRIEPAHFSARLNSAAPSAPSETGRGIALSQVERLHIQAVLEQNSWNIGRAAEILGIHRNTLTRKIAEHELQQ